MQQPSLTKYAMYIMERESSFLIEKDYGWASYGFVSDYCEVRDMWIDPDFRVQGKGTELLEEIIKEAQSNGYKNLLTRVVTSTNGADASLRAQLAYGFTLVKAQEDIIFLGKEI